MTIDAKIRALLAKTIKAGATGPEQVAATELARKLVLKHGLKETDFTWPAPPSKAAPKKTTKGAARAPQAAKPGKAPRPRAEPAREPKRAATRGDEVIELLRRKNGATIDEMVTRFGLQPHTLRAVISVETRKRGLTVERPERGRYRVPH